VVHDVMEGSNAHVAGILAGDIILQVDGKGPQYEHIMQGLGCLTDHQEAVLVLDREMEEPVSEQEDPRLREWLALSPRGPPEPEATEGDIAIALHGKAVEVERQTLLASAMAAEIRQLRAEQGDPASNTEKLRQQLVELERERDRIQDEELGLEEKHQAMLLERQEEEDAFEAQMMTSLLEAFDEADEEESFPFDADQKVHKKNLLEKMDTIEDVDKPYMVDFRHRIEKFEIFGANILPREVFVEEIRNFIQAQFSAVEKECEDKQPAEPCTELIPTTPQAQKDNSRLSTSEQNPEVWKEYCKREQPGLHEAKPSESHLIGARER